MPLPVRIGGVYVECHPLGLVSLIPLDGHSWVAAYRQPLNRLSDLPRLPRPALGVP